MSFENIRENETVLPSTSSNVSEIGLIKDGQMAENVNVSRNA